MIKIIQIGIATKNFQSSQGKSKITSMNAPSVNSVAKPFVQIYPIYELKKLPLRH